MIEHFGVRLFAPSYKLTFILPSDTIINTIVVL